MAKYDITSVDSPVVVYFFDEEVYLHPCSEREHMYFPAEPGAPVECIFCGSPYPIERKSMEQLRKEIWDRLKGGLRSPEYGYA